MAHALSATIERELAERFASADRRQAHVMLSQYGMSPHERDVEHVRRALLALSGGNLGRLGYLTEVDEEHLPDALEHLSAGAFGVEERLVLEVMWDDHARVAYNDVVLSRTPGRGQAALGLSVDGQLLVRYASDGVIAATPAGSTAYSYAAGGPIVSPQTRAMIVTPDAPHGLFNRAVVLGDEESLGVEVLPNSAPVAVEVDGQLLAEADPGWSLDITPNPWSALVVRLGSAGFAERARRKLGITDPAALANYDFAGHER